MEERLNIIDYSDLSRVGLPPILYKYREFDNQYHTHIITGNAVYFAAPNTFPDIKDCHPEEVFPSKEIVFKRYWEMSLREFPLMPDDSRIQYIQKQVSSAPILDEGTRDGLLEALFSDYCRCHGILSVTANPSNDRMWEDYANNHTGFCVGFDSIKLASISGGGGPVHYCNILPQIRIWVDSTEEEHVKRVFFKEKKWEYEQEYRLCKTWPLFAIKQDVERNIMLPKECIVSVICGKKMRKGEVSELELLIEKYQPQAKLLFE